MKHPTRIDEQPLRIAMVAACPFPSPRGSQVLIRELAQALARRGHTVHVLTYPRGERIVPLHGIFVHRVAPPRFARADLGVGWRRVILDAYLAIMLYRVVRREHIDVIHAHNYEGPLIGFLIRGLTGVPVVYHSHNALGDELAYYVKPGWRRSVARWVGRVLDRQVPRRADFSVALTPELETFLRARGVAASRVALVPPGAPVPVHGNVEGGTDPFAGRFVVMYTGNLDPYQGLEVLLTGFAAFQRNVPRAVLVLVTHEGDWAERLDGRLQALVQQGHVRVLVVPAFPAVRRLLARADVLVCPRSSWSGFPIKLLNYLAAGRAVVAAVGSAKGMVDGHTGLVFRDGDSQELALILHRLAMDPALRTRLGEAARAAVRSAPDWAQVAAQVERVYGHVCQRVVSGSLSARATRISETRGKTRGSMGLSGGRLSAGFSRRRG